METWSLENLKVAALGPSHFCSKDDVAFLGQSSLVEQQLCKCLDYENSKSTQELSALLRA
jgi:hypothetical protein